MDSYIIGVGKCLPKKFVSNVELFDKISNFDSEKATNSLSKKGYQIEGADEAKIFDFWVQMVCGIKTRPFVQDGEFLEDLQVEDMARQASVDALDDANLKASEIDTIIFSSYSSNRLIPSPACKLAEMLEINSQVRTLNGACSGFLDALIDAKIKIEGGFAKNILVVASENMSNKMNFDDPLSSIIFSDGAGACIVSAEKKVSRSIKLGYFHSATKYSEQVFMRSGENIFFNDGPYVQRNAVRTMFESTEFAMKKSDVTWDQIALVIPHQANLRIIRALADKINRTVEALSRERSQQGAHEVESGAKIKKESNKNLPLTYECIQGYGNLSSATVPVALYDYLEEKQKEESSSSEKNHVVLTSVGGGYTYSSMVVTL